ncbi:MAG TPA: ABC transporter permease [Pyrinomonadaceae bacterium]|jgi:ABC-type lipoprotein release transport system permease subunit
MSFFDILRLALRNLREAKLRAVLTTMGVVVGVAVIVTMVSFGLGLQRNTVERFKDLDLFNEITVSGRNIAGIITAQLEKRSGGDESANQNENADGDRDAEANDDDDGDDSPRRGNRKSSRRALDDAAIDEIARVPGVAYVEPNVDFRAYVRVNGHVRQQTIGGVRVPNAASRFKHFAAGEMISAPDTDEAVVDEGYLKIFGYKNAQEAVGQMLELLAPPEREGRAGTKEANADDDKNASRDNEPLSFFGIPLEDSDGGEGAKDGDDGADGAKNDEELVARRFRIVGVLKNEIEESGMGGSSRFRGLMPAANVYVPLAFAREWSASHRDVLDEVAVQLARQSGVLDASENEGYESATVRVDDPSMTKDVSRRLTEMGFSTFSLFNQLDEIRTFFLVVNSALGLLGSISLLVASLGIANTMIMSILERTREIGIMKAIGADDREIKLIFFVEAAVIGFAGGVVGALGAWGIARLANFLTFKFVLQPKGASYIDFFSLPPYLWLGAILFAMIIAIIAALYPAARAARIDPVRALRHD